VAFMPGEVELHAQFGDGRQASAYLVVTCIVYGGEDFPKREDVFPVGLANAGHRQLFRPPGVEPPPPWPSRSGPGSRSAIPNSGADCLPIAVDAAAAPHRHTLDLCGGALRGFMPLFKFDGRRAVGTSRRRLTPIMVCSWPGVSIRELSCGVRSSFCLCASPPLAFCRRPAYRKLPTLKVSLHSDLKIGRSYLGTTALISTHHGATWSIRHAVFAALDDNFEVKPKCRQVGCLVARQASLDLHPARRAGMAATASRWTAEECVASIKRWAAKDSMARAFRRVTELVGTRRQELKMVLNILPGWCWESLGK